MPKFKVQHFILRELPAIQESAPIESLVAGLIQRGIISSEESKTMKGERGMQRLYSKLERRSFKTFTLFVKCILEAGENDPSVNTCIVNSIRGVASNYDETHQTSYTQKIPQKKYALGVLESEDSEDDDDDRTSSVTSGYVSNATSSTFSTPTSSFDKDDPEAELEAVSDQTSAAVSDQTSAAMSDQTSAAVSDQTSAAVSDQTSAAVFERDTVELLRGGNRLVTSTASQSDDEKGIHLSLHLLFLQCLPTSVRMVLASTPTTTTLETSLGVASLSK